MAKLSTAQLEEVARLRSEGWTHAAIGARFGVSGAAISYRFREHYRLRAHENLGRTPEQRFWRKVDRSAGEDACWIWQGSTYPSGYGQFRIGSQRFAAHRVSIGYSGVAIPDGSVVHHECKTRLCVNPQHLSVMRAGAHVQLHHPVWTKEKILAAFHECREETGRLPRAIDFNVSMAKNRGEVETVERFQRYHWPSIKTIHDHFGTWNNLVRAAGFTPRPPRRRAAFSLSA